MQLLTKPSYLLGFSPRNGVPLYPSLRNGLVGAWAPCLGPTGLCVRDLVRGVHLDAWNGMDAAGDWVRSDGQYAIDLDGTNDYATSTLDLPTPAFPLSLCGWFYPRSGVVYKSIFRTNGSANASGAFIIIRANSTVAAGFGRPFGTSGIEDATFSHIANTATTAPDNTWSHIAAVIRGANNIDLWVNGVKTSVTYANSATTIQVSASQPVTIGRAFNAGSYRYGSSLYDDMLYYNRPLSDGEIILLSGGRGVAHALSNDRPLVGTVAPDITAPTLQTIVAVSDGFDLTFDEPVTLSDLTGVAFSASGSAISADSFTGDGTTTIHIVSSRAPGSTESFSFSYDAGTGNITDMAASPNALASISNRLVTNNVSATPGSVSLIGPGLIQ